MQALPPQKTVLESLRDFLPIAPPSISKGLCKRDELISEVLCIYAEEVVKYLLQRVVGLHPPDWYQTLNKVPCSSVNLPAAEHLNQSSSDAPQRSTQVYGEAVNYSPNHSSQTEERPGIPDSNIATINAPNPDSDTDNFDSLVIHVYCQSVGKDWQVT